jgi:hypothetical protein
MHNSPELDPKFLGKISTDFIKVADQLKEAAYQIKKRGFSDFPIFPISKTEIPIGSLLYEKGQFENDWIYNASFMEEFLQRELIEKEDEFKQVYKDPDEYCCLFVVDQEFTNFTFIPYPID